MTAVASKFRNVPVYVDGLRFDSKAEARRWSELRLLERAGEICDLKRQVPFECIVNGMKVCKYIADFTYQDHGQFIAEDAKGVATPVFLLKSKLMKACHNIDVKVTKVRK